MVLFWFRRDLRLEDNAALYQALKDNQEVLPIFIFDTDILDHLEDKRDMRVTFIHQKLDTINSQLKKVNSSLLIFHGQPEKIFEKIIAHHAVTKIYSNNDYEPYAVERDNKIKQLAAINHVEFLQFKDHVIFEKDEVLKDDGKPYTVYTPYMRRWKERLVQHSIEFFPSEDFFHHFRKTPPVKIMNLQQIGFLPGCKPIFNENPDPDIVRQYDKYRDFPGINGTSRIGPHLRFGTVSIRKIISMAQEMNEKWLDELIWREFYQMIIWHFPHTATASYKTDFEHFEWMNDEKQFETWCNGKTGYPLVDAGMRQLNTNGYMHNRVRLVVASFLTKHLLIDWRWGEHYFAQKLMDYELASNVGNWQWAAGTGVDPVPFRVFNPLLQAEKFDPGMKYIKKWVPEYNDPLHYPQPIVDHSFARERALSAYKKVLEKV